MTRNNQDSNHRSGLLVGGVLAGSVLLTGVIVLGGVACSSEQVRKGLSGPGASSPQALLAELKDDKGRIDKVTDDMMERIRDYNSSRKPGEREISFGEIFYDDLSNEQHDVLNQMLSQEKDVSYKALLQKLIEDRESVRDLQEKVLRLEQGLPDHFVIARQGDSQYELAKNYLTGEAGVAPDKAKTLLADLDMSDTLLPGNKVWFFYDADRDSFRTYITRGEAGSTPLAVRRAVQRKLISERDAAMAKNTELQANLDDVNGQVEEMIAKLDELSSKRDLLQTEIASLEESRSQLKERVADLTTDIAQRENSVFYHVAAEKDLREQGNLTLFKNFRDSKGVPFDQSLDLRVGSSIQVSANQFGLDEIKRVRLLPDIYVLDRDYAVEESEDGTSATIKILDRGLFRGKEVLLSVRG